MSNPSTESNSSKNKQRGPGGMGHGGGMIVEKPKNFKSSSLRLAKHLGKYPVQLTIVVIFAIASTIFAILGPDIMGKTTTLIFNGLVDKVTGGSGIPYDDILNKIVLLMILYGASTIFGFIQGIVMTNVAQKVSYKFREQLAAKINRLPLKYFDSKTHGEVLSRVTNDIDLISMSLNQSMSQAISSSVMIVGALVMMLKISLSMTVVALLIIPLSLFLVTLIVKNSQKYFKKQQEYLGHVNGHVEEIYGAHVVMKAFNGEEKAVEQFTEFNNTLHTTAWKSQFLSGIMMPAMTFVGNIGYVAVSVLGSFFVIKKKLEVGEILSFIQYIRNFTMPMTQMAQIANVFQSTIAASERVFEFLEEEEEIPDTLHPASVENLKGSVEFSNVNFGYVPETTIIHDFSATVKPGQKIAIVGPTGAGKTTIVKLLMRFYDVNSGEIKVDGIDIKDFKRNDLRSMLSMVLQDTWLFNGSIMENIRYGCLTASDEQVKKAASAAHVDHFINTLPNGYDMILNEEVTNISQGQKQLLTIARAILSDPKILILDEATSSVDTRTEVLIQKAMETLMEGRTSFIIAHRLSTIRNADLILVMDKGDIIEQGTHDELLDKNGFYANLYNTQFENGIGDFAE